MTIKVLGIDTSLRATGVGLIEWQDGVMRGVGYDIVRNPSGRPLSLSLLHLRNELAKLLEEEKPDVAAIEGVFHARYARTALILGHARGVAISTCAAASVPVFEYEPRRVKQAVVGFGAAAKSQVQQMVMRQLSLTKKPPEDAADALAIAICHLHNRVRLHLDSAAPL